MKIVWLMGGWMSFGIGAVGVVVPLLPTVPFMLLAAYCFARSSERVHEWLMTHPRFGRAIADWQAHGAINRRAKQLALATVMGSLLISLLIGVPLYAVAIQAAALTLVAIFILSRPDGPPPDVESR